MGVSWQRDDSDPIAPARGVVFAVLFSILGWIPFFAIVGAVWMVIK